MNIRNERISKMAVLKTLFRPFYLTYRQQLTYLLRFQIFPFGDEEYKFQSISLVPVK